MVKGEVLAVVPELSTRYDRRSMVRRSKGKGGSKNWSDMACGGSTDVYDAVRPEEV